MGEKETKIANIVAGLHEGAISHIQGKMKRTTINSKILTDTPLEAYAQQPAEVDITKMTVWKPFSS